MAGQDWFEKDFYATLGVPKDADEAAIKKAYRKLARTHHPDSNGGNDSRFKEVGEAYSVLSDPEQRKQYDTIRTMSAGGARFAPGECPEACQQLVPGSALLDDLNAVDETPAGPQWLSLWTQVDEVVTPPDSARLSGATNVVLQDLCPGSRVGHGQLPRDAAVQGVVLAALSAEPLTAPRACPAV